MNENDNEVEFDDEEWGVPVPEAAFEDLPDFDPDAVPQPMHDTGPPLSGDGSGEAVRTLELAIDVSRLLGTLAELDDRVPYKLGGKPSSIKLSVEAFLAERKAPSGVDCSGFVRWLLFNSSRGRVRIPDGSWNQREHFRAIADAAGVAGSPYMACGQQDGILRIAGFTASKARKIPVGHIWVVVDGLTGESHGGHGVNRRPWDTRALTNLATWCYPLARLPSSDG